MARITAADMEAVTELQQLGLVSANDQRVSFTEEGEAIISDIIAGMRSLGCRALT